MWPAARPGILGLMDVRSFRFGASLPITAGIGEGTPKQALAARVHRVREAAAGRIDDR